MRPRIIMDKIDRKIINSLQENARVSLRDLSKECFISSPAIAARINKLEKAGVINGYHSSIDMEKIGFHVRAFIQVQLEPRQKKEFYPFVQSVPNVVECNCVTGDYSEIMEVVFPSTTNLDDFINTIQQRFGKTSTQIVFSTSVNHRGIHLASNEPSDDEEEL